MSWKIFNDCLSQDDDLLQCTQSWFCFDFYIGECLDVPSRCVSSAVRRRADCESIVQRTITDSHVDLSQKSSSLRLKLGCGACVTVWIPVVGGTGLEGAMWFLWQWFWRICRECRRRGRTRPLQLDWCTGFVSVWHHSCWLLPGLKVCSTANILSSNLLSILFFRLLGVILHYLNALLVTPEWKRFPSHWKLLTSISVCLSYEYHWKMQRLLQILR